MPNVPLIVGGGDYPRKKVRRRTGVNKPGPRKPGPRKPGPKKPSPPKPRQPKPMPYYPETGSNKKPPVQRKPDLKDTLIKVWQDRNLSNQGTKLNP